MTRFARPQQLCSWAGMTPRHRESDTKVHRGRITKQGNHSGPLGRRRGRADASTAAPIGRARARIGERRGANIAKVAAARKLLTLVYYGLRDGHIRCLARRSVSIQSGAARTRGRSGLTPTPWRGRLSD